MRRGLLRIALVVLLSAVPVFAEPSPPLNFAARVFDLSVVLDWTPPPEGGSYQLEAGSAPGLSDLAIVFIPGVIVGQPVTYYAAHGVHPGTYFVRLRTIDNTGVSAPSNEVTVVVAGPGCQAAPRPPTLFAPRILDGLVTLQWSPGLETCFETTYAVFVGTVPGRADLAQLVAPAGTTSVWGTPPPGVYYAYLVAQNSIGVSTPSNVVEFRVGNAP